MAGAGSPRCLVEARQAKRPCHWDPTTDASDQVLLAPLLLLYNWLNHRRLLPPVSSLGRTGIELYYTMNSKDSFDNK